MMVLKKKKCSHGMTSKNFFLKQAAVIHGMASVYMKNNKTAVMNIYIKVYTGAPGRLSQ